MTCKCRHCGKHYEEAKSRADYKGYCSAPCLHDEARRLGYKPQKMLRSSELMKIDRPPTEYEVLKKANKIGSIDIYGDLVRPNRS